MSLKEWLQEQIIKASGKSVNKLTRKQLPDLDSLLPNVSAEWDDPHTAKMGALRAKLRPYLAANVSTKKVRAKLGVEGSVELGKSKKSQKGDSGRGRHDSPQQRMNRR